jgi:hypothetical protein
MPSILVIVHRTFRRADGRSVCWGAATSREPFADALGCRGVEDVSGIGAGVLIMTILPCWGRRVRHERLTQPDSLQRPSSASWETAVLLQQHHQQWLSCEVGASRT